MLRFHRAGPIEGADCPSNNPKRALVENAARPLRIIVALALYAMKAALYLAAKEARLSSAALAAKLGTSEKGIECH
jgi:hypothetical protein